MRALLLLLLLAACRAGAPASGRSAGGEPAHGAAQPSDTTPLAPQRGVLVMRLAGGSPAGSLSGPWAARLGACRDPRGLQLLARTDGGDLLLVLQVPAESGAVGEYRVTGLADTVRAGRSARVAAQWLQPTDLAYRGRGGVVRLDRLDRAASGRFDVTLQESPSDRDVRYLGVFDDIPVDTLAAATCREAPADSTTRAQPRKPA